MAIYLRIGLAEGDQKDAETVTVSDDQAIKGAGTQSGHVNWIPVAACEFTTPRKGVVTAVKCKRVVDGTSVALFKLSRVSEELAAIIEFTTEGSGAGFGLRVKLASVSLSQYQASSGATQATESFLLECEHSFIEYSEPLPPGGRDLGS